MSGATFPWTDLSAVEGVCKETKGLHSGGNGISDLAHVTGSATPCIRWYQRRMGVSHETQHSALGSGAHL